MKFALICAVDCSIQLSSEVVVSLEGKEYSFVPDATNTLRTIKVSAVVDRPERFSTGSLQHPIHGSTFAIVSDGELYAELTHDLQELESLLAFSCNLRKIHWEHPREERIADRPGEANFSFELKPEDQEEARIEVTNEELSSLLNNKKLLSPLTVVKSFWREARNAYNASRYISAFVNSFFILEGLYANGKFDKKQICFEFLGYPPFGVAVERVFTMVRNECPEHIDQLSAQLEQGKTLSVEEFTKLLVKTRAELSHFIARDLRKRERLFEENYWSISFVCIKLATLLIEHESELLVASRSTNQNPTAVSQN